MKYLLKPKIRAKIYQQLWVEKNKEKYTEYLKNYKTKNKTIINKKERDSRYEEKLLILNHYSNNRLCCNECGYNNTHALTIDHINGNGNKHRKSIRNSGGASFYKWLIKNNLPEGYQVLCWNCNHLEHLRKINYRGPAG